LKAGANMDLEKTTQDAFAVMGETAKKANQLSNRLFICCLALMITLIAVAAGWAITISSMTHSYFYSDYQYPSASQEVSQDGETQSVKQNIGGDK